MPNEQRRRNGIFRSCARDLRRIADYVRIVMSAKGMRCFDFLVILLVSAAYSINRFWLKNAVDWPVVSYILQCHFNDWLAGIGIIAYLNLVFSFSKYRHIRITQNRTAVPVCLICGVLWEYGFPLVYPHGTSDVWDIISYVLGGIVYILLSKQQKLITKNVIERKDGRL